MSFFLKTVSKGNNFCRFCNNCVIKRYYPAVRKRFYKQVHISESGDSKYEIHLDKRKLKTPLGNVMQLPNEALAVAVATEWDMQNDTLRQENMHITSLCNTALDNPCRDTKDTLVNSAVQFLISDTLCFRSSDPPDFIDLQNKEWNPHLEWFQTRYRVRVDACDDVSSNPVPDATVEEIRKQLSSYNTWCLIGINFVAENLKSLILTLAVINHRIDIEKAVALSRLETLFQVKRWGNVEWSHDVDRAQTTARVAAAAVFVYLNKGSKNFVEKFTEKQQKIKTVL